MSPAIPASWFPEIARRIDRAAALLTGQRIGAQATVLILACWIAYGAHAATGGLSKTGDRIAGDFVQFYALGSFAVTDRQEALFDEVELAETVRRLVPGLGDVRYPTPYGPQVSLLFAPLALLPYYWAVAIWITVTAVLFAVCVRAVWLTCTRLGNSGRNVALLAAAFPGFFYLIAFGQNGALALLCFTLAYLALRRGSRFLAGLAFGMLVFKPQLGLAVAVVFFLSGEWIILGGALVAGIVQLGTALLRFSPDVYLAYVGALTHVASIEQLTKPAHMQSLRGFFLLLVPWPTIVQVLTVGTTVAALLFALRIWRSRGPLSLRYAVLLLVTSLTTPHFHVWDLVVLAPALLLAADWAAGSPGHRMAPTVRVLIYASYVLPLLWPIAIISHVQISTLAIAALTLVLGRCALQHRSEPG